MHKCGPLTSGSFGKVNHYFEKKELRTGCTAALIRITELSDLETRFDNVFINQQVDTDSVNYELARFIILK